MEKLVTASASGVHQLYNVIADIDTWLLRLEISCICGLFSEYANDVNIFSLSFTCM